MEQVKVVLKNLSRTPIQNVEIVNGKFHVFPA